MPKRANIFISYSHKDAKWLQRLRTHLKPFERDYLIEVWDDTRITPGQRWREEIEKALGEARVAVLLVSPDFLASDFIANDELPALLRAAEKDGVTILPLLLSPSRFLRSNLSEFQAVNKPTRPLIGVDKAEQEMAFVLLIDTIESALGLSKEDKTLRTRRRAGAIEVDEDQVSEGNDKPSSAEGAVHSPDSVASEDRHGHNPDVNKAQEVHVRRGGSPGNKQVGPAEQLEPGTLLRSLYEIVQRIGGGMGAVYLARDRNLGNAPRAVKEVFRQNIDESQREKAINDFRRESMQLASLKHPSIPTIYDYFYEDDSGRFYLVMEHVPGDNLLARLRSARNHKIDELTVTKWAAQIADAFHYLHSQNPPIIYRDLKPANLMIDDESGRVMLIDFGVARWIAPQHDEVAAGTMGYVPPELLDGKVEPRSDIYSLGATMFHLLTGSDPQGNPLLIFDFDKNPRPCEINPSLSNEMEQILMRAVEYRPENRFRSAAEMRDTLAAHLERLKAGSVTHSPPSDASTRDIMHNAEPGEMIHCGFCRKRITADDIYCFHCQRLQPLAYARAALRFQNAKAMLVVTGTDEPNPLYFLQEESNLIGRIDSYSNIFPEVDLSRFDPQMKVSRRHARIFRKGDMYFLEDLGSVNGTIVNDNVRLAPHRPRALESGDRLRLSDTTLHFLIG